MEEKDKQLLLIDLCARLPYKPNVYIRGFVRPQPLHWSYLSTDSDWELPKPYLRTMSSMTEEETLTYTLLSNDTLSTSEQYSNRIIEFLNAHHFDYRGLIDKGLALEAPEGMYN